MRQEEVQKHFVKFIFGKSNVKGGLFGGDGPVEVQSFVGGSEGGGLAEDNTDAGQIMKMQQPVKVIHKDHDAITAFCINKVNVSQNWLFYQGFFGRFFQTQDQQKLSEILRNSEASDQTIVLFLVFFIS